MGTVKKLVGLGVVTGVVVFAFLRSFSAKIDRRLSEGMKEDALLV